MMHKIVDTGAAWSAQGLLSNDDWVYELSEKEIAEIDAALELANNSQRSLFQLEKRDFPLPTLSYKIAAFSEILENGIGTVMMKGLPIKSYKPQDQQTIYWCIGLYFGTAVSQSRIGELMMSIKDAEGAVEKSELRGLNTSSSLTFHTDLADVIGLLSLQAANIGGESTLVSSVAVHNEILKTRPDLLEVLYQPYCYASPGWDSSKPPLEMRPIFSLYKNRFSCNYVRGFIELAQEGTQVPRLTCKQIEALDYLDEVSNDPRFSIWFTLRPGDMLFFNNFVIQHSRSEFENDEAPEKHRHLLRLWLSVPNSRELPDSYKVSYRDTRAGNVRGGLYGE